MKLLVLSSYPEKDQIHGEKTVGVGNYTKATLLSMIKINTNLDITVFAESLGKKEEYIEKNIKVKRFWERGDVFSIIRLFVKASKREEKVVMLPFEMFMFGSMFHNYFVLPLLLLLKIRRKKIVLVLHQVLGGGISTFENNSIKAAFYGVVRKLFYSYLIFISHKTIVFEKEFKHRLGGNSKVVVIPHAVIKETVLDKEKSREELGLDKDKKYIFYFGFLSKYKGVPELLDIWEPLENIELIIGGGGNPNHMNKPDYKEFVDSVMQKAEQKGVKTTGFIPEDQMGAYFSAVDIVILPYTVFMASSGPLSHAFSYGKGVLLSKALKGYFKSEDMIEALNKSGISVEEICFELDKPIKDRIIWAVNNQDKLENFSKEMYKARNWGLIGHKYNQLVKEA